MKRRNFIGKGAIGLSLLPIAGFGRELNDKPLSSTTFYCSQSGLIAKDKFIYFGMLKSTNTPNDDQNISSFRTKLNYRTQLKFANNDKFKVSFANMVLDYFLNSTSLSITIQRSVTNTHGINKISRAERSRVRSSFIANLSTVSGAKSNDIVNVKSQYAFGSGKYFQEEMRDKIPSVVQDRIYYEQDLLQLSSFITSMVRADMNSDPLNLVNTNILSRFKEVAGVSRLDQINNSKIKII